MNTLLFRTGAPSTEKPTGGRFPEDFEGLKADAQIIGFLRPSFINTSVRPDYVLAANLVHDQQPAVPVLFGVMLGMHPVKVAEGKEALELFNQTTANNMARIMKSIE